MHSTRKRRSIKMLRLIKYILALGALLFILLPAVSNAVTGADWSANNIIDDDIFYNNNDMSIADIQNFLNSKVPTCDTWGIKQSEWGGGTRAQYGTSKGYPPPYTCLKDYYQDSKSAAQIIKEAADTYRISAKSLIVLLQKEQALVTDEWPWPIQYRSATGYGCPDTAPCDAEYYGFRNQVMKAAYQFRRYATYPSEYRYKPYQNNTIQFNPNTACGSTTVYIENLATAGLYNYTPYQPNTSALNNLYGSGDSCGAYGNRNFWRLFNDWFSSTKSGIAALQNYDRQHPTGSIIRKVGNVQVYKMVEGTKVLIPNYEIFLSQGYNDTQIKVWNRSDEVAPVSEQKLGYRSGTLLRENGNPAIYVIECSNQFYSSCIKRHISNYESFIGLGYNEQDVYQVASGQLSDIPLSTPLNIPKLHPNGALVRDASSGKIYLIKNSVRYYVQTWNLFLINRFKISNVKQMTPEDRALPSSEIFTVYDSPLLARPIGDIKVYSISDNLYGTTYKKHISNYDIFRLLGYKDNEVIPLERSIIDSYVTVQPYL